MHEVSIIEETLTIALESALQQQASKIHRLKMRIGEISGVVPEALKFAFDVVIQNTIAEDANLDIEIVPVLCYCPQCNLNFLPSELYYECPQCHQLSSKIISGKEIELTAIELS